VILRLPSRLCRRKMDRQDFLGPRDIHMVCVKCKKSALLPSEGVMYFRRPKNRLAKVVQECALNNRAWVIQERILAPRILTFAEGQVFRCAGR
jgi:hypothetical protein